MRADHETTHGENVFVLPVGRYRGGSRPGPIWLNAASTRTGGGSFKDDLSYWYPEGYQFAPTKKPRFNNQYARFGATFLSALKTLLRLTC